MEEFPAIVDHCVVHFAANGTSLSRWQIFAVVLDQLSVLHVARVVDEMRPLAATANNIIWIWLLNSGNVGLGFGWGNAMIHGVGGVILVEKNDVHPFTETVIESGSRTLVTELMMKDTADLSRKQQKRVQGKPGA